MLILTGIDSSGSKFHSTHTFHLLVNKTTPFPTTTTSTTSSKGSTTTATEVTSTLEIQTSFPSTNLKNRTLPEDAANSTTSGSGTVAPVSKAGINFITEFCAEAFFLALFGTIAVVLVPILTIAGIMYCICQQKKKKKNRYDKEKGFDDNLYEEHKIFLEKEPHPMIDLENNIPMNSMVPVTSL